MDATITSAFEILNRLAATSSRKEKEHILTETHDAEGPIWDLLRGLLTFSLDPMNYAGSVLQSPAPASDRDPPTALELTALLNGPPGAKYDPYGVRMEHLARWCSTNNSDWNLWMPRIISKALEVGVGLKTMDKFSPGTGNLEFRVGEADVLDPQDGESVRSLGSLFGDRYLIENRLSFRRAFLIALGVGCGMVLLERGQPIPSCSDLESIARTFPIRHTVLEGYLEMSGDGRPGEIPWAIQKPVHFHAYDAIPWGWFKSGGHVGDCPPYRARRQALEDGINIFPNGDAESLPMRLHEAKQFCSIDLSQHIRNCTTPNSLGSMLRSTEGRYPFTSDGTEWVKIRAPKSSR